MYRILLLPSCRGCRMPPPLAPHMGMDDMIMRHHPRIAAAAAIVAAGYIASLFVSVQLSPHRRLRRHRPPPRASPGRERVRRRILLQLNSFSDPKTVELRADGPGDIRPLVEESDAIARLIEEGGRDGVSGSDAPPLQMPMQMDMEGGGGPGLGQMPMPMAMPFEGSGGGYAMPMPGGGMVEGGAARPDPLVPVALGSVDQVPPRAGSYTVGGGVGEVASFTPPPHQEGAEEINPDALEEEINAAISKMSSISSNLDAPPSVETGTAAAEAEEEEALERVRPYTIDNALLTTKGFRYTLFLFVYDSASDEFVVVHNVPGCDYGCARIFRVASLTALALRRNFPGRFQKGDGRDLVFAMSTGDAPRVHKRCMSALRSYCHSDDYAPILQFGSVFVNNNYLPTMIAMPLPVRPHAPCFDDWQIKGMPEMGEEATVCQDLRPKSDFSDSSIKGGLVFGEELGLVRSEGYWDELIPQVIWRGTDFVFLHTMFQEMRAPEYDVDIAPYQKTMPEAGSPDDDRRWAIQMLWNMKRKLLPRWRGVLLTSEAEIEAREYAESVGEPKIPWVNIKFTSLNVDSVKVSAAEYLKYQQLARLGIACIGEYVNMTEQARYKYHIDLGGGGGTTWTGTIEKLALPGLLFHHVTPTKDWFHDLLIPWRHYVPVRTDLSDLRQKFDWAESHPLEAQRIAREASRFARWMGSTEGFGRLYEDYLVAPLNDVMKAYRPMPPKYKEKTALELIRERGEKEGFQEVGRCSGHHGNSCARLVR